MILLLILGIILFIVYIAIRINSDKMERQEYEYNRNHSLSGNYSPPQPQIPKSTYWNQYKSLNPERASELQQLTKLNFDYLDEKSVKEIIASFQRVANINNLQSFLQIKEVALKPFKDGFKEEGEMPILKIIDELIEKEVEEYHCKASNTVLHYVKDWFKEYVKKQLEAMSPSELFRYRYIEAIKMLMESYNVDILNQGCDSAACEAIVDLAEKTSHDKNMLWNAIQYDYSGDFLITIYKETDNALRKYCGVTYDEASEYIKNKTNKIITKKTGPKCPACGGTNTFCYDFECHCRDCGEDW